MGEYIEREAAIKAIYDSDPNGIRRTLGFNVGQIEEALRAVPAVSVPQWISVKDRLPENNERVLAFCTDKCVHDVLWSWSCWYGKTFVLKYKEVTHWMPIPKLPKGEAE